MSGTILNLCARVGDLLSADQTGSKISIPLEYRGSGRAGLAILQRAMQVCLFTGFGIYLKM